MLDVHVRLGALEGLADRFEALYQEGVDKMKATLDAKADEEKATHLYQNRTGDLEAETYASAVLTVGDTDEVQLGARTEYAEYVIEKDYSRLPQFAAEAEPEVREVFEELARRL